MKLKIANKSISRNKYSRAKKVSGLSETEFEEIFSGVTQVAIDELSGDSLGRIIKAIANKCFLNVSKVYHVYGQSMWHNGMRI